MSSTNRQVEEDRNPESRLAEEPSAEYQAALVCLKQKRIDLALLIYPSALGEAEREEDQDSD